VSEACRAASVLICLSVLCKDVRITVSRVFGGVCPPLGDTLHHYQFTVWALKVEKLPLDEQASGALVGYMLNANVLGKATITPTYARQ
jgi:Raf kinase inhibitor-like YbhB/YbcL family protein